MHICKTPHAKKFSKRKCEKQVTFLRNYKLNNVLTTNKIPKSSILKLNGIGLGCA
jgi:hypothetical protein